MYELNNTQMGELKELHHNLLYPLWLVRTDEDYMPTVTIPVISKQNIVQLKGVQLLMDNYFACDCLNCMETVWFWRGRKGYLLMQIENHLKSKT